MSALPIEAVLPSILSELERQPRLVIQAPPGAGKTTRLPLELLDVPWIEGRILLIQPRRLAVQGAARRLAAMSGMALGTRIGYRTRFDSRTSASVRIEVITEGIFLRWIQDDPSLQGVGLVMFDEFHERAVNVDLGLAFALESQREWREAGQPLRIIVMSATLDGDRLSRWLVAPCIVSQGRQFPVDTRYLPPPVGVLPERHTVAVIQRMLREESGDVLVFLPGFREMRRVETGLTEAGLSDDVVLHLLHASLPPEAQDAAIAPAPAGRRKVVLSTNVAETSVTIEGIRVVIDSGWARVSVHDERRGMASLETERISAASAEQRRGRAGRLMPGVCVRLWSETEQAGLRPFPEPDILRTDVAPVVLELAAWGVSSADALQWLDMPPSDPWTRAREMLTRLDALDARGCITALGRSMVSLPLSPRLARLVLEASRTPAAEAAIAAAALLTEGDPWSLGQGTQADLGMRLAAWSRPEASVPRGRWQRLQASCRQLAERVGIGWTSRPVETSELGGALARAFPDRVAMRRGDSSRFLMANGKGVQVAREDRLAGDSLIVVLDTDGAGTEPRVRLALALSMTTLQSALGHQMKRGPVCQWNVSRQAVEVEEQCRLGALVLERRSLPPPWPVEAAQLLVERLRESGGALLPWDDSTRAFQARFLWLHARDPARWPDLSDAAIVQAFETTLAPWLEGRYSLARLRDLDLMAALRAAVPWEVQRAAEQAAPEHWSLPTGESRRIDYAADNGPVLRGRLQEFYGLRAHPSLSDGTRLLLELLSPAHRPLQVTRDLPGFWSGSYREVAKEMRGRYPKHDWPQDPANAKATTRTKRHEARLSSDLKN